MANKIVVDPVTRIEGHLRIEAVVENGKIVDAYASSTMFRGMKNLQKGIPEMPGISHSAFAAFAPLCIQLHQSGL